ncbi:MAG: hypothetical protein LBG15_03535 [Dysgonamonadaceae bacterium]|jgi:hypothetical protein|nr:hypothetical protein [Dysgonamonadaceae bacterium]
MHKKLINCFFVILFIFLYSCEYELEDINYVELKKQEDQIIDIKLNAPVNDKGEYIIYYDHVKWTLEGPDNYRIYHVHLSGDFFGSVYWGDGYLNFYNYGIQSFSLKCEMRLLPDTAKSIAEVNGYEYLEKVVEWKFVPDPKPIPLLYLKCEEKGNRTYRLSWEKPDPYYGEIDRYEVHIYYYSIGSSYYLTNEVFFDITLPDNVSYFRYEIQACFKENYLSSLQEYGYMYLD